MARICSFLLLATLAVVTFKVFCEDLQPVRLYRRSSSKLDSKLLFNRVTTLRSGGEILNNCIGKLMR